MGTAMIVMVMPSGVGVMMAVPFAILGALIAIALRGTANDLYFQIGLLTLVGLALYLAFAGGEKQPA